MERDVLRGPSAAKYGCPATAASFRGIERMPRVVEERCGDGKPVEAANKRHTFRASYMRGDANSQHLLVFILR